MNFPITEDVQDLLKILRETGFDWIADEVHNVIREGKSVDKLVPRPTSKSMANALMETATVEFPPDEQLAIALASIREYTVLTASILRTVQVEVAEPLRKTDPRPEDKNEVTIQLVSDEDAQLATLDPDSVARILSPAVAGALEALEVSLKESWPVSQGRYGARVRDSGRRVE
jgi:hypothetical protein